MKLGYFADGPWSHKAFEMIINDKRLNMLFVVARFSKPDQILKKLAEDNNIDFLVFENINSVSAVSRLKDYRADLFISLSYDQIIRKDLLKLPPKGFINCHAGALPFYRGRNVLNWVLINGESEFGITVHYIDEGIDTGDIILQKNYPIYLSDNYNTLLERSYDYCSDLLMKSLLMIVDNKVIRIKQIDIDNIVSYCQRRLPGDEILNWNLESEKINNFVRGITFPGPCARTFYGINEIMIIKSELTAEKVNSNFKNGTILKSQKDKFLVKTKDNSLLVTSFLFSDGKKKEIKAGMILKDRKSEI